MTNPIQIDPGKTIPDSTGPPRGWEDRVADAVSAGIERGFQARPGQHEERPVTSKPVSRVALVALVLALIANAGLLAAVVAHIVGNSAYETQQEEMGRELKEGLDANRKAIYVLIDEVARHHPGAERAERELAR